MLSLFSMSRQPFVGELVVDMEDAKYDGCVTVCSMVQSGTAVELVQAGIRR